MTNVESERPLGLSIRRGLMLRCPNCGQGHVMRTYLKLQDACPECGQELYHSRADDGPAYLTILVVRHLLAPFIHIVFTSWRPEPMVMALGFSVACVALSLFLLPRMKGMMVGIQWAKRMYGFGAPHQDA